MGLVHTICTHHSIPKPFYSMGWASVTHTHIHFKAYTPHPQCPHFNPLSNQKNTPTPRTRTTHTHTLFARQKETTSHMQHNG